MDKNIKCLFYENGTMLKGLRNNKSEEVKKAIKYVYELTKDYIQVLDEASDLSTRIKSVKDNMLDFKCCEKNCNNQKKFYRSSYKWSNYCGKKCATPSAIKNGQKTMMKKYGTSSYMNTKEFRKFAIDNNKSLDHITNIDKFYNKKFINNKFIDKDTLFFNVQAFKEFFNCNQTTANKKIRDLNIKFKVNKHGFDQNKHAILYYICIDEKYYKIGITNNDVRHRFRDEKRKRIRIVEETHFIIGQYAYEEEQKILKKYKKYLTDDKVFQKSFGNTEIFNIDILELDMIIDKELK
jgi:hypothetical protein